MKQQSVRCAIYRGGTSRGLFFHERDLPVERSKWGPIFLEAIDAYNMSQINGLGGGTSHTSKVIVVHPASREDVAFDYTFYQIGIGEPIVDDVGTCGNLMASVGAFAVNERYIEVAEDDVAVTLRTLNRNIDRVVEMTVPVTQKEARVYGEDQMAGVVQKGAFIRLNILSPGGGKTGQTFPAGVVSTLDIEGEHYDVTFADIVNPFVYVEASALGLTDYGSNADWVHEKERLETLRRIRVQASVAYGVTKNEEEAWQFPAVPKVAIVYPPQTYTTTSGVVIHPSDYDILVRMTSMDRIHRTFAGSGLYNVASVVGIEGTIPARYSSPIDRPYVRVAHPDGIIRVDVTWNATRTDVEGVGLPRTAKRIMEGNVFVNASLLE